MPPKLSMTQRRVSVGDMVQWEHFSLATSFRATGNRDSSIMAGAGIRCASTPPRAALTLTPPLTVPCPGAPDEAPGRSSKGGARYCKHRATIVLVELPKQITDRKNDLEIVRKID